MGTRTATVAVAVAALVVLAGCAGSASRATTEPETETAESTTEAALPPGVTADGVENASALVAAHRTALAESGYAYRVRYATEADSFSQQGTARAVVGRDHAPVRVRSVSDVRTGNRTQRVRTDTWANETVALYEYRTGNRTVYQKSAAALDADPGRDSAERSAPLDVVAEASMSSIVGLALRTGEYEVAGTEVRNGSTLTTLRATGPNESAEGLGNASAYDATLVVDERGRVHELDLDVETDRTATDYEFELADLGGVRVEYPAWADRALATVNADIEVDSRENYFVVSNRAGDALPAGSEVRVGHAGANVTLELDRALAPGEEAYVYFPADRADPTLAREPPAAGEVAPLDGEYEFSVVDPTGDALVNATLGFERATEATTVGE